MEEIIQETIQEGISMFKKRSYLFLNPNIIISDIKPIFKKDSIILNITLINLESIIQNEHLSFNIKKDLFIKDKTYLSFIKNSGLVYNLILENTKPYHKK